MKREYRFGTLFKVISVFIAGIFLWNQISWAADLYSAIDAFNEEQTKAYAPDWLVETQNTNENAVSTMQDIEAWNSNLQANEEDVQETLNPEEELNLQQKTSAETPIYMAAVAAEGEADPGETPNDFSITTVNGDVIHYANGAISRIEMADGTLIIVTEMDGEGNLLDAIIHYVDGATQVLVDGKTASIKKPDGTTLYYDSEERIDYITNSSGEVIEDYTYIIGADGNVTEIIVTNSDGEFHYDSNGKIFKAIKSDNTVINYSEGRIASIIKPDLSSSFYTYTENATEEGVNYVAILESSSDSDGVSVHYIYDENGNITDTEFTFSDGTEVSQVSLNPETGALWLADVLIGGSEQTSVENGELICNIKDPDINYDVNGYPIEIRFSDGVIFNMYISGILSERRVEYSDGRILFINYENSIINKITYTDINSIVSEINFDGGLTKEIVLKNRNISGMPGDLILVYDEQGEEVLRKVRLENGLNLTKIIASTKGSLYFLKYENYSIAYSIRNDSNNPLVSIFSSPLAETAEEINLAKSILASLTNVSDEFMEDVRTIDSILDLKLEILLQSENLEILNQQYNTIISQKTQAEGDLARIISEIQTLEENRALKQSEYQAELLSAQILLAELEDTYNTAVLETQAKLTDLNQAIALLNNAQTQYDANVPSLIQNQATAQANLDNLLARITELEALFDPELKAAYEQALIDLPILQNELDTKSQELATLDASIQSLTQQYNTIISQKTQAEGDLARIISEIQTLEENRALKQSEYHIMRFEMPKLNIMKICRFWKMTSSVFYNILVIWKVA